MRRIGKTQEEFERSAELGTQDKTRQAIRNTERRIAKGQFWAAEGTRVGWTAPWPRLIQDGVAALAKKQGKLPPWLAGRHATALRQVRGAASLATRRAARVVVWTGPRVTHWARPVTEALQRRKRKKFAAAGLVCGETAVASTIANSRVWVLAVATWRYPTTLRGLPRPLGRL